MGPNPSDRDKLRTRFLEAEDSELCLVIESPGSGRLERAVAREILLQRGADVPDAPAEDETPPAHDAPFQRVPEPDPPRRAGDGRRVGLALVGIGLLVTQGLRLWAREQENRARWDETVRSAQLYQSAAPPPELALDPEVLAAIERGEPITIGADGRIVVAAHRTVAASEDEAATPEEECRAEPGRCVELGLALEPGEGAADRERALAMYERACDSGIDEGCRHLRRLGGAAPEAPR